MRPMTGVHHPHDRRTFLAAGALNLFGLPLAATAAPGVPPRRGTARSTIFIWLSGGASHIDTWDMKPDAPAEYRGLFRPVPTRTPASACASICRTWRDRPTTWPSSAPWATTAAAPATTTPATTTT